MKQCKQCQKEFESNRKDTQYCSAACRLKSHRNVSHQKAETFHDLPADVQASIERDCAENNGGARDASHSRAAMTERALTYQRVCGKHQPSPTGACQTCGGPVQHPTVVKCLTCCTGETLPAPVPTPEPADSGPLSIYSDRRWAYLQYKGYEWFHDRDRAEHPTKGTVAVTVPGDPGYKGIESLPKAG